MNARLCLGMFMCTHIRARIKGLTKKKEKRANKRPKNPHNERRQEGFAVKLFQSVCVCMSGRGQ